MNLVDTSGWIEFFFGGENASHFVDPIEDMAQLIVPVVFFMKSLRKPITLGTKQKLYRQLRK